MGESNEAGNNVVVFAMSHYIYERRNIYKSGAAEPHIGYILCSRSDKGNIKDGKVILGESVTLNQHRRVVCTLISSKATERNHRE